MRKAKYSVGQRLRTVRGPGGALNPEPRFLGHVGTIVKVQEFKTCQSVYVLDFEALGEDTVEEVCLEEPGHVPSRSPVPGVIVRHSGVSKHIEYRAR